MKTGEGFVLCVGRIFCTGQNDWLALSFMILSVNVLQSGRTVNY